MRRVEPIAIMRLIGAPRAFEALLEQATARSIKISEVGPPVVRLFRVEQVAGIVRPAQKFSVFAELGAVCRV